MRKPIAPGNEMEAPLLFGNEIGTVGRAGGHADESFEAFAAPVREMMLSSVADEAEAPRDPKATLKRSFGFYWTEGTRGLGGAVDAIPTLKGGSAVGIAGQAVAPGGVNSAVTSELGDKHQVVAVAQIADNRFRVVVVRVFGQH